MYAFIDLRSRMFITKEPDEKDAAKQRASMVRQLPRVQASNPEAVIRVVHMDDTSDIIDWESDEVVGPKGGPAVISAATEASKAGKPFDLAAVNRDHRRALRIAKEDFTVVLTKLQDAYEKKIADGLKGAPTKAMPATVQEAGYGPDGKWLEAGTAIKPKKAK